MRLLFTALACLISASVFGQNNTLLHEAFSDSLIGEPDEAGCLEIWQPNYHNSGTSSTSFEFALFNALEKIIALNGDTIMQIDDLMGRIVKIEYVLKNLNNDSINLNMIQFFLDRSSFTDIAIEINNVVIAFYSSEFNQVDLKEVRTQEVDPNDFNYEEFKSAFDAEMASLNSENSSIEEISSLDIQKSKISYSYDMVSHEVSIPSEGVVWTESYKFPISCNFKCLVYKLHEVNYDFTFIFKGGYNVWKIAKEE